MVSQNGMFDLKCQRLLKLEVLVDSDAIYVLVGQEHCFNTYCNKEKIGKAFWDYYYTFDVCLLRI